MSEDFKLPVGIGEFAAYLDGNLSQSEMLRFSQMAARDGALHQLLEASEEVDDTLAGFTDTDLQLPREIMGSDFELPDIDHVNSFSVTGDSFSDNNPLYQQEENDIDSQHGESHSSLVDEIFDDLYNSMVDDDGTIETDVDVDMNFLDNEDDIDTDLFDLDI